MKRQFLALFVAVLLVGLAACAAPADKQKEVAVPSGPVAGYSEITSGVTLSITIPARELLSGATTTATVVVENTSGAIATVFDIVGLRIRRRSGVTVWDSLAGLRFMSAQRELASGESRVVHIPLVVPRVGSYFLDAYLYGSGLPSGGETSATVEFTSVEE